MPLRREGYGILGGVFDPPHVGHLIIAQFIRQEFSLKKIIFVPAGNPPHKTGYSAFPLRRRMTELAVSGNRNFRVDPIEGRMTGKTYTAQVVKNLKMIYARPLFFIIGADQWAEIGTWKDPSSLFRICRMIVVPRSGHPVRPRPPRVLVSRAPRIDISSTMIRALVTEDLSIEYLTPDPVVKYIREHNLKKQWIK